jgi:membrane-bound lytic murein transglycosylase D
VGIAVSKKCNLVRIKQILAVFTFSLFVFMAKAEEQPVPVNIISGIPGDTTLKKDTVSEEIPVNDPKKDFKNLFSTAITGDGMSGARLNPMAVGFVKNYISKNKFGLDKMKNWGKPYFDLMDEILTQHGIPKELKYLAVIESGLKNNAVSWAGAVGPWAFMPAAAQEYGLRITKYRDDRRDYFKSTHAAARYLTDLYELYNDWLLVIAAYNSGPGNVNKAIRRSGGSKDFWAIQYYLPNESMNHVKKFIATHYIFEGQGGVTTVTKNEIKNLVLKADSNLSDDELNTTTAYNITGRFNSSVILKYIDMEVAEFNRYNPDFDNKIAVDGKYELRLPTQKMNTFVSKRYEILEESIQSLLKSATTESK